MDKYKVCQYHNLGIGGIECDCCNNLARKSGNRVDKRFNRMARARFKRETNRLILKEIGD